MDSITLFAIDGTGTELDCYLKIFDLCSKEFNFKKYTIVTASENIPTSDNIQFFKINKLNYKEYQSFCVLETAKYIDTDYALFIQSDGFVVNGSNWNPEYLNYDYVGQPWLSESGKVFSWITDNNESVGEGGFSLRSKKLLDFCSKFDKNQINNLVQYGSNEDFIICITARNLLKQNGFKFCTPELGKQFCAGIDIFNPEKLNNSFGFHGDGYVKHVLNKYKEKYKLDYSEQIINYKNKFGEKI